MTKTNALISVTAGVVLVFGETTGFTAVEAVSETYAGIGTYLEGSRRGVERQTFFSAQCVCPSVYAGQVSAVQGSVITDSSAQWVNNQFNGANGAFYVEFDSGLMVDIADTVAGQHTLTLEGEVDGLVQPGDAYHVRRHMTLSDMFGRTNEIGLMAGPTADQADNVLLHVPELQETQAFYYHNQPGAEGWRRVDDTPAGNRVVFPEQGVILRRKGAGRITLFQHGAVKQGPMLVPIQEGTNLVGTVKLRKSFKLADLNLYTGDPATGLAPGDSPDDADNVILVNPLKLTSKRYFYSTNRLGRAGWFDENYRSASRVVIPAGRAFYVLRKPPRGLFYWSIPTGK
jgi:uncharacterized protein (TIGR02597 family)